MVRIDGDITKDAELTIRGNDDEILKKYKEALNRLVSAIQTNEQIGDADDGEKDCRIVKIQYISEELEEALNLDHEHFDEIKKD